MDSSHRELNKQSNETGGLHLLWVIQKVKPISVEFLPLQLAGAKPGYGDSLHYLPA